MTTIDDTATAALSDTDRLERVLLQQEIEAFLFEEAQLLDTWKYRDWLGLFTEDTTYWMPIRRSRLRRQRPGDELVRTQVEAAHFDENWFTMQMRVQQLESGQRWAEEPPSRTRHLVTNVTVTEVEADEYDVRSNFICYRNRLDIEEDVWAGQRHDRLRRVDGELRIAARAILFDQSVVLSKNLSVFL